MAPKKRLLIKRITQWDNNRVVDLMKQLLAGKIKRSVLEEEMKRLRNRAKMPDGRKVQKPTAVSVTFSLIASMDWFKFRRCFGYDRLHAQFKTERSQEGDDRR